MNVTPEMLEFIIDVIAFYADQKNYKEERQFAQKQCGATIPFDSFSAIVKDNGNRARVLGAILTQTDLEVDNFKIKRIN